MEELQLLRRRTTTTTTSSKTTATTTTTTTGSTSMMMTRGKVNENVKLLRMIRGQKRSLRPRAFVDDGGQSEASEDVPSTILSSAFNTSRLEDEKSSSEISSSKNVVKCECQRVRRKRDFKAGLIYSTLVLLVSTHLFFFAIQTVSANPAIAVPPEKTYSSTESPKSDSENSPHFDVYRVENHTVQLGGIAFLPCIIKNLGNKSVSWIRGRDSHILTVDREVFIMDRRFSTIHRKDSATWTLQIKSVQAHDAGKYECQISTEPKLSHFVFLTVIVPRVRIFGDRDIFVKSSSTVQLKCVISQSLSPPTYIEWLRNDEERLPSSFLGVSSAVSFDQNRRMQTTQPEHIAEGTTMSTLSILNAKPSDSGKYTCKPAQLEQASVNLHVLESDLPALMQTSQGSVNRSPTFILLFLAFILINNNHLQFTISRS